MTVLDANLLLYASNADAPLHGRASKWIEGLFASEELVGLPWVTIWAFLRIATNARLYRTPLEPEAAFEIVQSWLDLPNVELIEPGARHLDLLRGLVKSGQASGPMLSDAVLAAIAIEYGASLASTDQDFSRFPKLAWINPLGAAEPQ